MKIVFLDEYSICGRNIDSIKQLGEYIGYEATAPDQVVERCKEAEVIITNKVVIDAATMVIFLRILRMFLNQVQILKNLHLLY